MSRLPSLFLVLLCACTTGEDLGQRGPSWIAHLDSRLHEAVQGRVQISVIAVDADHPREVVFARQPRLRARPASTTKLLTTAAFLHELGPQGNVKTEVLSLAEDPSVLCLVGHGDPLLSEDDIETLARTLKSQALNISGIVYDATAFEGPAWGEGWMWDDLGSTDQPSVEALTQDVGCVRIRFEETPEGTVPRFPPYVPWSVAYVVRDDKSKSVEVGSIDRSERRAVLHGPAKVDAGTEIRVALPAPAEIASRHLAFSLGVPWSGPRGSRALRGTVLASTEHSISEILRKTNKSSQNLGAECLLRLLGSRTGGSPSARSGLERVRAYLGNLGVLPEDLRLVDGSGLSHYNLVSPETLVRVLCDLWSRPGLKEAFLDSLPISGQDGTLAGRMKGTEVAGKVRAKTGTLRGVSALAGFVSCSSGRTCAFAIMIEGFTGPSAPWRELQDEFVTTLLREG